MMVDTEEVASLEEFRAEAQAFLDSVSNLRDVDRDRRFVWGKGSDNVALFKTTSAEEIEKARAWRRQVFDAGFGWITGPIEYGGRGLSSAYQRVYDELERRYDVPGPALFSVSLGCIAPTLEAFGSAELKQRWLGGLYRGDLFGCQLFSEPGAGSDLASVSTNARWDGSNWVISGQKVWTSRAQFSDLGLLLTRTSLEPRHKNLTMFIVDMTSPGIDIRPLREMTGGEEFNEVFLDDVVVPDAQRLGEVGHGWQVAMRTLMYERNSVGDTAAGGGGILRTDRLVELMRMMGVLEDPIVRRRFAELYVRLNAARFCRQRISAKRQDGQKPGPEMSATKLQLTRNLNAVSEFVQEVLGDRLTADTGEWGTFAWTNFVLGVPGLRLGGGSDEIQKNIIGERVLGLPR